MTMTTLYMSFTISDTENPARVTCRTCRNSVAFRLRPGATYQEPTP